MSYHYFCKNCHFWFAYFNTMKSNYCPNCGLKLSFDFPLTTIKEWMDYS
jgi:predicted amidophosphoribosyltransferase